MITKGMYNIKPFVKWAGGKRQILDKIIRYVDDSLSEDGEQGKKRKYCYIEPFLGGGAVFFYLQPQRAIINDLNNDLINAYEVIKSNKYEELIEALKVHREQYLNEEMREEYYYDLRQWDREDGWPNNKNEVERAARMIFLNKTCYNGLYRVNSKGQFNTPIGRYKNPLICDENNIREIHNYFQSNPEIEIMSGSYQNAIRKAVAGDIIYIDPPYDYEDDDGFTKYQMNGFTFEDFRDLKEECDKALSKGAYIIISNNATEKVIDLFEQDAQYKVFYDPERFDTLRTISCDGTNRKAGREVIIWGIPNNIPLPQANDVNKIINLLSLSKDDLRDKEKIKNSIQVDTIRQVSYYLSALSFLKYINNKHVFTHRALEIKSMPKEEQLIEVANDILDQDIFRMLYNKYSIDDKEKLKNGTIKELKKKYPNLSDATIQRRSSTILNWFKWACENTSK